MNIVSSALKIVNYPHPALRHKAVPIKGIDDRVRHLAAGMLDLMYEAKGLGLAAPQVGMPYQMFVCTLMGDKDVKEMEYVLLNPVIVERRGTMEGEEGCLSFPGMYRKVRRARTVKAQAYNLDGRILDIEVSDLASRIVQHETDHLDGTLFIDKLGPIGQLSSRGDLAAFEQEYRRAQRRGEIPADADIERVLTELEKLA
jgi:peptide deformylase